MTFVIKGNFIDTPSPDDFRVREGGYLIIEKGKVCGYRDTPPRDTGERQFFDYSDKLIIPSFCDMHLHGPQFLQRGLGMDRELIGWLNDYTFPREARYGDPAYAREAYEVFADSLYRAGSLRSCVFGTVHRTGTVILAEEMEKRGLAACVGKVNMDSNAPDYIRETGEDSLRETVKFLEDMAGFSRIKPIITPRFVPSCSGGLLGKLGDLAKERDLPVQSHLCETVKEVAWVKELFPEGESYSHIYDRAGLLREGKTLMAHGIYMSEDDLERIKRTGTVLVHCPDSNLNLASGIMDTSGLMDGGIALALGSDVGGGHELPMNRVIVSAVQSSKTRRHFLGQGRELSHEEAFYLATRGGLSIWDNTGCFDEGCLFDALVIDDRMPHREELTLTDRLYRYLYTSTGGDQIAARFLEGRRI